MKRILTRMLVTLTPINRDCKCDSDRYKFANTTLVRSSIRVHNRNHTQGTQLENYVIPPFAVLLERAAPGTASRRAFSLRFVFCV